MSWAILMLRFCWSLFLVLLYRRVSTTKSTQTWSGRGTLSNRTVTVSLLCLWNTLIFGHYVSRSQNPQAKPFSRAVMRQKCQLSCSAPEGSAALCLLNILTIYSALFLFIKKSGKKQEWKTNTKIILRQRGGNGVGGDTLAFQYSLISFFSFGMEVEHHPWEAHRSLYQKYRDCTKIKLCLFLPSSFVLSRTQSLLPSIYRWLVTAPPNS